MLYGGKGSLHSQQWHLKNAASTFDLQFCQQDGSVADSAGLLVGDMILAVNSEDFVGASYETAAKVLKKIDGEIKVGKKLYLLLIVLYSKGSGKKYS